MFLPWYLPSLFIVVGLAICAVITLAPLSKRKALEVAAQTAADETPDVARFDGLDAASELDDESAEPDAQPTITAPSRKATP